VEYGAGIVLDMGIWIGKGIHKHGRIALCVGLHLITVGLQALALLP
jgi:hypothetical protein